MRKNLKLKTPGFVSSVKFLFLRITLGIYLAGFLLVGCSFAEQTADAESASVQSSSVDRVCDLLYEGRFDAAGELIKQSGPGKQPPMKQLAEIVAQYQQIAARRSAERAAKYKEQLAELEKIKAAADTNDANGTKALSIVVMACEFAGENEKKELLSEPFVKKTIEKSRLKAGELESKGRWFDAYINCYSLLEVIDENNQQYGDYAGKLYEKSNIVASFQDSPCETSTERFSGVNEEAFIRAVGILNYNYVNPVDYREMVRGAVKRCQLLAEVMGTATSESLPGLKNSFTPPDKAKLALFSSTLQGLLNDLDKKMTGISKDKFVEIFKKVLELSSTTAQMPRPVVIAQFAEAAFESLDPYTVIVWPQQKQDFEKVMTSEFTGIGIEISREKGLLTVASLLPDTPAYNSGLDAGDVIEKVDGAPTKDMSITCAVRKITGPAGTKVALTIKRPGQEQSQELTLTRARIIVPTVRGWQRTAPSASENLHNGAHQAGKRLYMIDDRSKIGYVRLTNFSERTSADLEKVLRQLEAEGLKGLILDLRWNSGGFLNSAVEVTDKFLEKGTIVITRPRFWISSTYAGARREGTHPNYPLVILINRGSASASEIVAGALADKAHRRAILVGERTHGKGSVQGIAAYPDGGAQLKYTMAYYHLPSGQRVESREVMKKQGRKDWGVGPNVEVVLNADELKKMLDVQRENDVLVKADHDEGAVPLKKHTLEETLAADPQLAMGVLVMKTKLIQAESTRNKAGSEI